MQETLHADPNYGVASIKYAPLVAAVIEQSGATEILDYGAGKGRLRESLPEHLTTPVDISEYDPAIPGKDLTPEPRELVVCIDVLEHIEPDLLDNVMDELKRVTKRFGFFTVDCGPAGKVLPDGRNAHLTQEDLGWWIPKFEKRFVIHSLARIPSGFWITVLKNGN